MRKLPITIAAARLLRVRGQLRSPTPADDIIAKNKCHSCHTATTTKKASVVGRRRQEVQGDAGAEAKLVEMLKTGGADDHKKVARERRRPEGGRQKVLASK
jgi:cytochrome c551/c552